jgi:hypothetical protein
MLYEDVAYLQENRKELATLLALPLDGVRGLRLRNALCRLSTIS